MPTPSDAAAYLALGLVIGFMSGLFGVGGSSISTPLLRLIDVPRMIALATPLPVTLPTALVGGFVYWRRGWVKKRVLIWTVLGGTPGVVVGSLLTEVVPGRMLMLLTGCFVVAVGVRLLQPVVDEQPEPDPQGPPVAVLVAVGAAVGLLSGLLANGGGFLLVPAYLVVCRLAIQEAAATSLVAVGFLATPGTWIHWRLGHVDWAMALGLATGAVPSTYAGARLGSNLPKERARFLFGLFLTVFGAMFLWRTVYRAEVYGWLT
ncbi:MAG: sulfite exporter TauE/SafE family protein [Candidatus Wallbacteria bacterium]|nr:sulfite exporter TauE/SafE family protein [Candidatus Wallbacteria bacterium]